MVSKAHPKKLRFNCYLIHDGVTDVEQALRAKYRSSGDSPLTRIASSAAAPPNSVAFVGETTETTPSWATELNSQFPGIASVTNRSNRFVIFVPVATRWFAICFGYGSGVLDWEKVESNFGLRVAARRFRSDNVTELRSRRIDATARTQSVQVPVGSELRDLGVELDGEFIRKLSGQLESGDFEDIEGSVVAGDSIAFRSEVDLKTVQSLLSSMLDTVARTSAQDEFQFVDSLEPLRESEQTAKDLDTRLAAEILRIDVGITHPLVNYKQHILEFAPPDDVQLDEVEAIQVRNGEHRSTLTKFDLGSLREALREAHVRRGHGFLKGVRLMAYGGDGEPRSQLLPLRNWLVYEVGNQSVRYVLTLGRWFRLQEKYSHRLNADLRKIKDVSALLDLPTTSESEHEGVYNSIACAGRDDLVLMDAVNIKTEDRTGIESCDIFHLDGYLIHVKR
ncbi:hypothetical protein GYA89_07395 [Rhodococcus qingshengii]|nr:hypothetical protein [Rhodococcus qingshengii]